MNAATRSWPFPGLVWGSYPQRGIDAGAAGRRPSLGAHALRRTALELDSAWRRVADPDSELADLRRIPQARRDGAWLGRALAAAAAVMASEQGLQPHGQQLMAARALLDQRLVEMDTGEGKTVAIALAAAVAALAGTPVHVVTANDYLAARDARELEPFYRRLGLQVTAIAQPMDMEARRTAYLGDVVYCTAKELAFDYLRDRLLQPGDLSPLERRLRAPQAPHPPVLRGLCMAILDEADTLLVDEARVPLVLSRPAGDAAERAFLQAALAVAERCEEGIHYAVGAHAAPRLLPAAQALLAQWPAHADPLLAHPQHRATTLELAIVATRLLVRDQDYVVRDGQVLLVDETTGRTAPGRAWSRGLHQLLELKEGVAGTQRNTTVTEITYQGFFTRYLKLAGISGTLRGAALELWWVYGLRMVRVAPRTPRRVRHLGVRLFRSGAEAWEAVAERAANLRAAGRAVLVGTETVAQSEALSAVLRARGMEHTLLHARQDREESAVIAGAGRAGCITVATSMAGRGAHIALDAAVVDAGGLHVILCQLNPSARIDRQFLGRAGRQGQPGSCEVLLALDFGIPTRRLSEAWRAWLGHPRLLRWGGRVSLWAARKVEDFTRMQQRVTLARNAERRERALNFSRWGMG